MRPLQFTLSMLTLLLFLPTLAGCNSLMEQLHAESQSDASADTEHDGDHHEHSSRIVATSPLRKDVTTTQEYVCQIHSCQHIEVRALEGGYLQEIHVQEGQAVKKGELMFKILPTLYQAKLDSETAEAQRLQIQLDNSQILLQKGIVSTQEIAIRKAELARAQANVKQATAELSFTDVVAPFDGIVDRQLCQLGSLIEEGDVLTTLSDNSLMWVYFNVPEARYLEYKEELDRHNGNSDHLQIELRLANGEVFSQPGKIGAIEADFNNMTGNIAFRADFPNPNGLLRNGQTGTILIHRQLDDVLVIPQRATFEILARRYAYVVDQDNIVHQRDIVVGEEQDDIFVLKDGLQEEERIVLEGIRQVRDGDHVEYEYQAPAEVLNNQKYHAE
ncbi:MAG: efflux RND transporter periplasmic adaptor subunit [Planctomycetaceae bacterium]|nr:efflux RND transporter periplasmic adaptor subunit [Planctomycetaceae bacterium]